MLRLAAPPLTGLGRWLPRLAGLLRRQCTRDVSQLTATHARCRQWWRRPVLTGWARRAGAGAAALLLAGAGAGADSPRLPFDFLPRLPTAWNPSSMFICELPSPPFIDGASRTNHKARAETVQWWRSTLSHSWIRHHSSLSTPPTSARTEEGVLWARRGFRLCAWAPSSRSRECAAVRSRVQETSRSLHMIGRGQELPLPCCRPSRAGVRLRGGRAAAGVGHF